MSPNDYLTPVAILAVAIVISVWVAARTSAPHGKPGRS